MRLEQFRSAGNAVFGVSTVESAIMSFNTALTNPAQVLPKSWLEAFQTGALSGFHRLLANDPNAALETEPALDRSELERCLSLYLARLSVPKASLANAKRIAHPNSRVVMTGQQAGVLLGPGYTISKAVNAILLARELDSETRPVIPVFWVASQDHDVAEVASTYFLGLDEELHKLELNLPQNQAIARIALKPEWLEQTLVFIKEIPATTEHRNWILKEVEAAFHASSNFADWFASLLLRLLGEHGLVVFDPMDVNLAPLFKSQIKTELAAPLASSEAIESAAQKLEALGFSPQLRRAAGATNLFLEGEDGVRRLLKFDGLVFTADRSYSRTDLEAILEQNPSRITPAAGLRPTLQDAVLPNAINVLGPGELAYHLELNGVYQLHGVPQPLLHPRMTITILEPPVKRMLAKYGLSAAEFQKNGAELLTQKLFEQTSANQNIQTELTSIMQAFERMEHELLVFEPGFAKNVWRAKANVRFQIENRLTHKLAAAYTRANTDTQNQLIRLERHLMPEGEPQERRISFLSHLIKFGPVLIDRILKLNPRGAHWLEI
jgi:bacillithiol biosynthesis cysteine-adding enzyme BshC